MPQVTEPFPIFYDDDGTPLENGMVYIGEQNQDPRINPIVVYIDAGLSVPIAQPIRTLGGRPSHQGSPVSLYVLEPGYSIAIFNKYGTPITNSATNGGTENANDVSFIASGVGAASRTVEDKLREYVSPEDFTGTDTAKFNAALATGKPVRCTAATYNITGTLSPTVAGQIIDLNGSRIVATGNFNVFSVSGLQGVIIRNGRIEGAAMTGGDVFNASNVERLTIENVLVFNPFNFAFIEEANVVEIRNVWVNNIRGSYGVRWLGDAVKDSDILRLVGLVMSFPDSGIGIDWDGNCHTLQAFGVAIIRPNIGVRIQNTAGGPVPEFGFFTNIEIDFPVSHGVDILAGESYFFGPQFYCHSSTTGSGVRIASGLPAKRIGFYGGKISGHALYGIENNVRVFFANTLLTGNVTADFLDRNNAVVDTPRLEIDGTYFLRTDASSNPILQFDANDFISYGRSANDMNFSIGGSVRMTVSTARVNFTSPPQLPVVAVSALPSAVGAAGREYYVNDANATTRLSIVAGGGANFVKVFSNGTNWVIA